MMPSDFGKMKGKLYVKIEGNNNWSEVEEPCSLNEVIDFCKEQAQIKRMKELIEHLKKKVREKKLEDVMSEHIAVIFHELRHCFVNHFDKEWPWNSFDFVHQTAVMAEEAGEAIRAANNMREGKGDQMALYNELAQTAAMCLRIMDQIKEYSVYGDTDH